MWYVVLPTPKTVGQYTLDLELMMGCCKNAPSYSLKRKLFVTKHSNAEFYSAFGTPKREWYEKAVPWAQDTEYEDEILEKLLKEVYSYGSKWLYDGLDECRGETGRMVTWDKLIDDQDTCKNGDCFKFSKVFENLAGVLGIGGLEQNIKKLKPFKNFPMPFVLIPGMVSVDPDFKGNTRLRTEGSPFDRYLFSQHDTRLRNSKYYDVTFNQISSSESAFIEFNAKEIIVSPPEAYYNTIEGAKVYDIHVEDSANKYNIWRTYELELPDSPLKATSHGAQLIATTKLPPTFSDVTFKTESGTASATALIAEVEALLPDPANYVIYGLLKKNGEAIVGIPTYNSLSPVSISIMGGEGVHNFELKFSGEAIYQSQEDGPYTLELYAGSVSAAFETPAYVHSDFGEIKARVVSATEQLTDSDGNGLYDELIVKASLLVREAATFDLHGTLVNGEKTISVATQSLDLPAGTSEVNLVFPGESIGDNSGTHEYEVVLNLLNLEGPNQDSFSYTTAAIESSDFESFLKISGDIEDEGYDPDGDGLQNELRIVFDAQVSSSGTYTFSGVLSDPDGDEFAYATKSYTMTADTPARIELGFSYLQINAREKNGPFSIDDVLLIDADGRILDRASLNYTTGDYAYSDFEPSYTITFGNTHVEQLTDIDKNCLVDTLTIYLPVISTRDGTLQVSGDLYGADGREVASGTGSVTVTGGVPAQLPISFDGRYLYGSLQHDTFELRNVLVYPQSDYSQSHHLDTPLDTSSYNYLEFEPSAVVTGTVHDPDVAGAYAIGASIYSQGDSDTVDENGNYRLVFLDEASKTLQVYYSANSGAIWQVYVDDVFIAEQNFAYITSEIGVVQTVDFRSNEPLPID